MIAVKLRVREPVVRRMAVRVAPMANCVRYLLAGLVAVFVAVSPAAAGKIKHVIVIVMENTNASEIYGNTSEAPYLNNMLMPIAARSSNFTDTLALDLPSQPHYIIMEAGKRTFADQTFSVSDDPSASYSTGSLSHLTHQMRATIAPAKVTWMSYQQSIDAATGACPIESSYPYVARHNPFVYFRSISGNPPSKTGAYCAAHHRPYSAFAADLAAGRIAKYVFITPDQCHNMHDQCASASRIRAGDDWLASELPRMIAWANGHSAVILVAWDEGHGTLRMPFFAVGAGVKKNFVSSVKLTHRSIVKSVEMIFGVSILPAVANDNSLQSLFAAGSFP